MLTFFFRIAFFGIALPFSFAHAVEPSPGPSPTQKEQAYFTGTLKMDCECSESYFTFADMETVAKKVKFKKGDTLGRLCMQKNQDVACRVDYDDPQTKGGIVCTSSCVLLVKSSVLTKGEKESLFEKSLEDNRKKFRSEIPTKVLADFEKRFPQWDPPISIRGNYQQLSPTYALTDHSVLKAPISYSTQEKSINEWFVVIVFFSDRKAAISQQPTWGLWRIGDAEFIYSSQFRDKAAMVPPRKIVLHIYFRAGDPLITQFGYEWYDHTREEYSQTGSVLESELNSLVGKKEVKPISGQDEHYWVNSAAIGVNDLTSVLRLIDGPANIRSSPAVKAPAVQSCKNGSVAVFSDWDKKAAINGWYKVFCDGKEGWTQRKNLIPFPKP